MRWGIAALMLVHVAGCGTGVFECQTDDQCSPGLCIADGFCGFEDDRCDSGLRYGELSGALAGKCVPLMGTSSTTDESSSSPATTLTTAPDPTSSVTATSVDPSTTTSDESTSTTDGPVDPSLVLWLDFEGAEADWLSDRSLYANHVECPDPCPTQVDGLLGKAAGFDGASVIEVRHSESLTTPLGFTLALWHRVDVFDGLQRSMLTKATQDVFNSWELYYFPNVCVDCLIIGMAYAEDEVSVQAAESTPPAEWVHVAATWDGSLLTLYANADEVGQTRIDELQMLDQPVLIGADDDGLPIGYDGYFIGSIDDVRIYDRALSKDEITALAFPM